MRQTLLPTLFQKSFQKLFLTLFLTILCGLSLPLVTATTAAAQISFTRADLEALLGTRQVVNTFDATDLTGAAAIAATSGANQTWDFTTMTFEATDTFAVDYMTDFSAAPGASLFPTATFATRGYADGNPAPSDSAGFFFQRLEDTGLYRVGFSAEGDVDMLPPDPDLVTATFTPESLDLPLPFEFGTSFHDSTDQRTSINGVEALVTTEITDEEVDGWGTLILPEGSFDALRGFSREILKPEFFPPDTSYYVEFSSKAFVFAFIELNEDMIPVAADYEIWNGAALGVELAGLEVQHERGVARLRWETHSETNNVGFSVEHQAPGRSFTDIAFVDGGGTTSASQRYEHNVLVSEPGVHRFRLKQVDTDGSSTYSSAVEVTVELQERFVLERAYPNPFNPRSTIRFGVADEQPVRVAMFNLLGQEVDLLFDDFAEADRMYELRIDGSSIPSGMYLIRMEGPTFVESRTVTLLK